MRIALIGVFAADYMISLANALAEANPVALFFSQQDLAGYFPRVADPVAYLREKQLLHPAIDPHPIDYPTGRYTQKASLVAGLVHAVRDLDPDVVHIQSSGGPWVPLAMPFLGRYPLVATIHDVAHHLGDWPPGATLAIINTWVARLSRQVIVHGEQQADLLERVVHVPSQKVNVIPIGAYDLFRRLGGTEVLPEGKTVLFFGRLREYKGLEVLIRAVPRVAARVPGVRFVIAGAGECPALARAAAAHPEWYEVHNRFIEAWEVAGYFERAALVVQPYLEASQSGVLPLAALFERAVVATRVGSIPEALEDGRTGILVEPGDAIGLADAITGLLENPELCARMGKAAAAKMEQDKSWESIAEKTQNVYERAREGRVRAAKRAMISNQAKWE